MSGARPAVPAEGGASRLADAGQPAACEVYVYFRSAPAQAAAVRAALARQRRLVESACGASVRVGLRLEPGAAPKDYLTWLEVYRLQAGPTTLGAPGPVDAGAVDAVQDDTGAAGTGVADTCVAGTGPLDGLLDTIERCARDSGLGVLAMEGRHREVFTLLAEPATAPGPPAPSGAAPRAR